MNNKLNSMNEFIKKNISKIIILFLFLSPIFDLITSIQTNLFNFSFNFIIIIKLFFMGLFIYYLTFISKTKYKKISLIYLFLIFIYFILYFFMVIYYKETSSLVYEIQNLFRNFYFIINLICLFNIYIYNKTDNLDKTVSKTLIIYILLIFIPTITKIGFNSYAYSKEGSLGLFNSTNEIGGILSILLPLGIYSLFNMKNKLLKLIIFLVSLYTYFSLGTKVPILSLIIVLILISLKYIYELFKKSEFKKLSIMFVSIIIIFVSGFIFIPKTSFYKNIIIHLEFLEIDSISDFKEPHIIDHFIFSERVTFYERTLNNYKKSSLYEKLIGIGYMKESGIDKTIEMDYFDILFRHGIIGFIIYFIPYIYILVNIFKKTKKLTKVDNYLYYLYISLILILVLSLFSGHIITSPSVSMFALIILIILNRKLEYNESMLFNNKLQ